MGAKRMNRFKLFAAAERPILGLGSYGKSEIRGGYGWPRPGASVRFWDWVRMAKSALRRGGDGRPAFAARESARWADFVSLAHAASMLSKRMAAGMSFGEQVIGNRANILFGILGPS